MTLQELLDQKKIAYEMVEGEPQPVLIPAVLDENDEEIEPQHWSYDVEELQTELDNINTDIALQARWMAVGGDPGMLFNLWLVGVEMTDDDVINPDLFILSRGSSGWAVANKAAPTLEDLEDLMAPATIAQEQAALVAEKKAKGRACRMACESVLDLIGGFNIDRELTFEQKNEMKTIFANAKSALNDLQPGYAKYFINLITPDEVLVTTEMKMLCLAELAAY